MSEKIRIIAKDIAESMCDFLLGVVTERSAEIQSSTNKSISPCTMNLYFESAYFSIDFMVKRITANFSVDEKRLLIEELHKNLVTWIIETLFPAENNPANYQEKVRSIYYDTLNARNLAYSNPKNENRMIFREILFEEFRDAGVKKDKSYFDSLSSDIINSLDTLSVNY
ncbi:MAG: hypothetical protein AABY28_04220 [Candidatus Omnitrophota bacterium]